MNGLSSKLDRKDKCTQYKPRIHPERNRGCGQRQNRTAIINVMETIDLEMETE